MLVEERARDGVNANPVRPRPTGSVADSDPRSRIPPRTVYVGPPTRHARRGHCTSRLATQRHKKQPHARTRARARAEPTRCRGGARNASILIWTSVPTRVHSELYIETAIQNGPRANPKTYGRCVGRGPWRAGARRGRVGGTCTRPACGIRPWAYIHGEERPNWGMDFPQN